MPVELPWRIHWHFQQVVVFAHGFRDMLVCEYSAHECVVSLFVSASFKVSVGLIKPRCYVGRVYFIMLFMFQTKTFSALIEVETHDSRAILISTLS